MAYIPSRRKKHRVTSRVDRLNLTSMMDMFTIILVFLLKSFASEGQLIQPSDSLTLPKSTIHNKPVTALDLVVSKQMILLNGKPVMSFEQLQKTRGFILKPLKQALDVHARKAKEMEEQYGIPFTGKVTIQGDESIAYRDLVKVMATCGAADFPNMRLVVYQKES
ncbi:MAG: biopolymer transporter ExbD [Calditrichaeota bacterium]|nr:MAG: biopolymer transporter ExbD [Calditrichota bacterium]